MLAERPAVERRILAALEATPPRLPVIVGGCGSGRTTVLHRLAELLGSETEYIDVERIATTPEGCLSSVTQTAGCQAPEMRAGSDDTGSARAAFDHICHFLEHARTPSGASVTFLLDEALEVRTFESFPGLRGALREFWQTLCESPNRFVLTTRFATRSLRLFRDAPERFEFVHLPPLTPSEVTTALTRLDIGNTNDERLELARIIHALTDGRPLYLRLLAEATATMGAGDPVSALAAQMAPGAPLSMACRFCYELRLHRARGYGALKAILQILAKEEPLTLTEIAHRLRRTPGSTKDYLSWLEDVDLLTVRQKRYSFADPVLRLWVHLHGQSKPPGEEDLAREAQEYAVSRFPYMEPAMTMPERPIASADRDAKDPSWSLIEID
ncbi:MAG: hypothetical protein CL477_10910 [Acidobacteria bacterium]|nr:hypothetical protein [Acidobacteriota bacterium]MDP7481110.1 hypothetical protein [Vicinamibacterales bacterium]MDP7690563.1 hypothetical protein [Vicinamibacterales bacterium]HJN44213.1 hypothetical protein [Vicinamibacterales bacterium]